MEREELPKRLRELRLNAGISQQVLGSRLGRPQSYVSKIENGERRVELHEVEEWARAAGKTMVWAFVDGEPAPAGTGDPSGGIVARVARLIPQLSPSDLAHLQNTVDYLGERIEGDRRQR